MFTVTYVVAAPGAWEPLTKRHTEAERNHLVTFTVVGFTVGVRQMVTDAFHNGIQSGRNAAFSLRSLPVILLVAIQIEADIVNLLTDTRLDAVTLVIAKQVILFMLIIFLCGISKTVVTTG
ncbi:hypothetical protein D3C80_664310 [compost metagenome]